MFRTAISVFVVLFLGIGSGFSQTPNAAPIEAIGTPPAIAQATPATTAGPSLDILALKNEFSDYIDRYTEKQMAYVNWVLGLIGIVGFFAIGVAGYLVKRYVDNAKDTIELMTSDTLFRKLENETKSGKDFTKLVLELRDANDSYIRIKESLDGLKEFHKLTESTRVDSSFAYDRVRHLAADYKRASMGGNIEEMRAIRSEALNLLEIVLDAAKRAEVDPNTVFNSAANAGRLDFDTVELQLHTLAYHLQPSQAHLIGKADSEHKMGRSYTYENGALTILTRPPEEVRKNAFELAIEAVRKNPRQQCDIIFSRAWNMVERSREDGSIDICIDAIEKTAPSINDTDSQPSTSYAYVILFQLYIRRSDSTWRKDALAAAERAIAALKNESPLATWYGSSIKGLSEFSHKSGFTDEISDLARKAGLDIDILPDISRLLAAARANSTNDAGEAGRNDNA